MFEGNLKPASCTFSSGLQIDKLVEASKKLSHGNDFVLLLDSGAKTERFLPACANAYMRMKENASRANSMQMEVLLFISGNMNVSNAIARAGAKNPRNFIAFASGSALLRRFAKATGSKVVGKHNLKLDMNVSGKVSILPILNDK